jgi:hypothetical protein
MVPDDHKLYDILKETNTKHTVLPYVPFQDYGQYYIIEINSLNCAGWYNSDYKKIVSTVNELLSRPDC